MKQQNTKNTKINTQKLIYTGMLAALAGVLMSLEISVPMMPPFYKVDFSDVPSLIALFLMGPASGAAVEVIKIVIKLVTVGTNTMYVGEFANLIGIVLFILPCQLVFTKRGKTLRAAAEAMIVSVPVRTAFACFCNACITLPLYAKAMGLTLDGVVQVVAKVNPAITNLTTFIVLATIPFNVIKISLNCLVAYFLYDRLKKANVVQKLMAN